MVKFYKAAEPKVHSNKKTRCEITSTPTPFVIIPPFVVDQDATIETAAYAVNDHVHWLPFKKDTNELYNKPVGCPGLGKPTWGKLSPCDLCKKVAQKQEPLKNAEAKKDKAELEKLKPVKDWVNAFSVRKDWKMNVKRFDNDMLGYISITEKAWTAFSKVKKDADKYSKKFGKTGNAINDGAVFWIWKEKQSNGFDEYQFALSNPNEEDSEIIQFYTFTESVLSRIENECLDLSKTAPRVSVKQMKEIVDSDLDPDVIKKCVENSMQESDESSNDKLVDVSAMSDDEFKKKLSSDDIPF